MGSEKKTVAFYTLGCRVNQYETEALRERLAERGFYAVEAGEGADVSVINTCTVTGVADRKSRQLIRRARRANPGGIVAVVGCYAQVRPEDVAAMGADIVLGSGDKGRLPELICGIAELRGDVAASLDFDGLGSVASMGSRTRAMIKIEDGCDRRCAFCVIPYARGPVRSRDAGSVVAEARGFVEAGYKELVLTGINMALYGSDFSGSPETDIDYLLGRINGIEGDFRIRMGSLEPTVIDAAYAKKLLRFEKLCPSLHLSLQSGSDRVLAAMGRNYSRKGYLDLVGALKGHDPNFGISTDIIAGFPGETEEDFADSLSLVGAADFLHVHVFPFSAREGTKAAGMDGQISAEAKTLRSKALIAAGEASAARFIQSNIGRERVVLAEKFHKREGLLEGLTENGLRVYFIGSEDRIGNFANVRLEALKDGRILGVLV